MLFQTDNLDDSDNDEPLGEDGDEEVSDGEEEDDGFEDVEDDDEEDGDDDDEDVSGLKNEISDSGDSSLQNFIIRNNLNFPNNHYPNYVNYFQDKTQKRLQIVSKTIPIQDHKMKNLQNKLKIQKRKAEIKSNTCIYYLTLMFCYMFSFSFQVLKAVP